jgi:hypothetical protein
MEMVGHGEAPGYGPGPSLILLLDGNYGAKSERIAYLLEVLTNFDRAVGRSLLIQIPHAGDEKSALDNILRQAWTEEERRWFQPPQILFLSKGLNHFEPTRDDWQLVDLLPYANPDSGKIAFGPVRHLFSHIEREIEAKVGLVDALENYRLKFNRDQFLNAGEFAVGVNLGLLKASWKAPKGMLRRIGARH